MERLIGLFPASKGGLGAFRQMLKSEAFDDSTRGQVETVQRLIGKAIKYGPVHYSGSDRIGGKIFSRAENKGFTMPGEIWTELSLLGRWIEDSLVLRWAEFTSNLAGAETDTASIVQLLLESLEERRDVTEARDLFREQAKQASLLCVWTGKKLSEEALAVDHAIPFSLWRNNDLWNLLPADSGANLRKRDRLPTLMLVEKSKDRIIECWEMLYTRYKHRFLKETREFSGRDTIKDFSRSSRTELFSVFKESIEVTALQRGTPRWNG